MSHAGHQRTAKAAHLVVRVGIITASDSRTPATDDSGRLAAKLLKGRDVTGPVVVPDDVKKIQKGVDDLVSQKVDAIVVNGGTGLGPRDVTVEALRPWFTKELTGFGERFRALSVPKIGSGAWMTGATAGVIERNGRRVLLFLLPGSPEAVRLGVTKLIQPELDHAVSILRGPHHA